MKIRSYITRIRHSKQFYLQIIGVVLICIGIVIVFSNRGNTYTKKNNDTIDVISSGSSSKKEMVYEQTRGIQDALYSMDMGLTPEQTILLENTYDQKKNIDIAKTLLKYYILHNDFDTAYNFLSKIKDNKQLDALSGDVVPFITFNYSVLHPEKTDIRLTLTTSENKEVYELLYALVDKDYSSFVSMLDTASKDEKIKKQSLIAAFLQNRQTYKTLRDSPSYYYTGLLAVSLMDGGYIPLATNLAKDILLQDKNYILSYELLSQIAIKEKKYQDAIKYLQMLMKIDAPHIPRTSFFLGMCYYYLADYANAIVYLNQVRDTTYVYDAVRYLILIHSKQGEYDSMMSEFRFLLTEQKLEENDYALFFDILFYMPYRQGGVSGDYSLAHQYAISLVVPYIDGCQKQLSGKAPYVCKYGEAGWYLSQNKLDKALKDLLYLSKMYPQPIVFQALGDYYSIQNDTEKAKIYYQKALLQDATK